MTAIPETRADATAVRVRRIGPGQRPRVAAVLSRAFADDPVFTWMIPDQSRRNTVLYPLFSVFAWAFRRHGETYLTADGQAAALWSPPGPEPVVAEDVALFDRRLGAILGDDMDRTLEVTSRLAEHHPHERCWYLQFLGAAPEAQGGGRGGALLRAVLDRADHAGEAAYLEATSDRNRALYERHGFVATAEIAVPQGPSLWAMWRDPQSTAAS